MSASKPLTNRDMPLSGSATRILAPAFALLCFLAQCLGQGTMQFRFEAVPRGTTLTTGEYWESGMRFWNAYGPQALVLAGGGIAQRPENGTGSLQATPRASLAFGFYTFPGTPFNLLSFDAAEYATGSPGPVSFLVVGYQGMGLTVTNLFTTDGVNDGTGPLNDFETLHLGPEFVHWHPTARPKRV